MKNTVWDHGFYLNSGNSTGQSSRSRNTSKACLCARFLRAPWAYFCTKDTTTSSSASPCGNGSRFSRARENILHQLQPSCSRLRVMAFPAHFLLLQASGAQLWPLLCLFPQPGSPRAKSQAKTRNKSLFVTQLAESVSCRLL